MIKFDTVDRLIVLWTLGDPLSAGATTASFEPGAVDEAFRFVLTR